MHPETLCRGNAARSLRDRTLVNMLIRQLTTVVPITPSGDDACKVASGWATFGQLVNPCL